MKKLSLTATTLFTSLVLASNASAYVNGAYLGGALGWGNIHQAGFTDFPNNSSNDSGLAGRVFAGYKFNDYVALESGFTKFSNMNANGSGNYVYNNTNIFVSANGTIKTFAVDLVVKGILPLQHGISLFGTLGGAYVDQYVNVSLTGQTVVGGFYGNTDGTEDTFAPTFGLGASYDITQNLVADLSWSHIQQVDSSNSNVGNTDFLGLGLSYHFS